MRSRGTEIHELCADCPNADGDLIAETENFETEGENHANGQKGQEMAVRTSVSLVGHSVLRASIIPHNTQTCLLLC